jgi:hypothetical protein
MPRAEARAGATGDAGGQRAERCEVQKHKPTTANYPRTARSSSAFNFRVKDWARKGGKMPLVTTSHQADRTILRSAYQRFLLDLLFSAASFEVKSEPHTGARPSVRLCVGLNEDN